MVKRSLLALSAALLAGGCSEDPITQVIVVVDSDLAVPAELDQIAIDVTSPGGATQSSIADLGAGEPSLPRTLTLVHTGGSRGPFTVRAVGLAGGSAVVSRTASFDFQSDQSLVLTMHLAAACRGQTCPTGQTCTERGCESVMSTARLTVWTGTPPRIGETPMIDMGVGEDMCRAEVCNDADDDCDGAVDEDVATGDETCNEIDDDCDGSVDEGFDTQNDRMNCGACGVECIFRNGSGTCTGGSCVIASCETGFEDCDSDGTNGCEVDTTTNANNCNGCGNVCRNGADRICCASVCQRSCP